MTPENGKNIRIEYIRSMLKRTNITFVRRKKSKSRDVSPENNLAHDKPSKAVIKYRRPVSLEDNFPSYKPGKSVSFHDQITINGNLTKVRSQSQQDDKNNSPKRTISSETRQRPKSEDIPNDRKMTSLQQKQKIERAEISKPKFGTIRKSYEPDKKFKPLEVVKAFEPAPETQESSTPVNELVRFNGMSPGSEYEMDESVPIATFPFVEDNELEKHKKLNADAERMGQQRSPGPYDSYLKRLKLERKAKESNKQKEQQKAANNKKKALFKRLQSKPRFIREVKEDLEMKTPPPPVKSKEERASRIMLDFKYSHAVEQFYGGRVRQSVNFSPMSDSYVDYSNGDITEVKNGCIVKTLGANVLNMQARTLPSCNPFEMRMRIRIAREKAMLAKKELLEQQARERPQPSEALRRFKRISNFRRGASTFLDRIKPPVVDSEHARDDAGRASVDSQTGLPEIRVDRVENLVTRSLDSSPDGPEYMRNSAHPHTRIITLNLPTVTMEDV